MKTRLLALLLAVCLLAALGLNAAAANASCILKNDRFYCEIPKNYLFAGGNHFCFVSGDDGATRSIDIYTEPNRSRLSVSSASEKALKTAFTAAYSAHSEQTVTNPAYQTGRVNGCYAFGVHFTESFGNVNTPAEAYLLATEEWQYLIVFRCFSVDFVMADDVQTLLESFVMNGTLNAGDSPERTVDFSDAITYEEELEAFDSGEGAVERKESTANDEVGIRLVKFMLGTVLTFGALFDVFVLIMLVYVIRKYRAAKQANERYLRRYGFPAPDMKNAPAPYPPQAYTPYVTYPIYPPYPYYAPYPPPAAPAPAAPASVPQEPVNPADPAEPDTPAETIENEEESV